MASADAEVLPILPAFQSRFDTLLAMLEQGRRLASDTQRSAADFGIGLEQLRLVDVPLMLVRWLLMKGYVEIAHVEEDRLLPESWESAATAGETDRQVLVLTDSGEWLVEQLRTGEHVGSASSMGNSAVPNTSQVADGIAPADQQQGQVVPVWDDVRKELWYSGQLIKRYKVPSINQETVLTAFQEEGWTLRIDDPLPQTAGQNPAIRLGNTIKALNRSQKQVLIRFRGDGTGEGVLWEPVNSRRLHT